MKHFYTLALIFSSAALNAFAAWDGSASQWTVGSGTESDPYLIENEQHFAYLQKNVAENETYEGKFFCLAADLDMDGKTLNPIGFHDDYSLDGEWVEASKVFLGTFDGAYFTIDNVNVELASPDVDEIGGVGLFAVGRAATTIKNLRLGSNVVVSSTSYMTGGVMGISYGATIENCSFAGTINGGQGETGGIVGRGEKGSVVKGCVNSGNVIGNTSTGGVIGSAESAAISDCLHTGSVNGNEGYMVAGIIGWAAKSELTSCVSLGEVKGIVGYSFLPGISPVCSEFEQSTASACYYVKALTGCDPLSAQSGIEAVSEDVMKSAETLSTLNGGEAEGAWAAVDGDYPTLAWTLNQTAGIASVVASDAVEVTVCGSMISINAENAVYSVADIAGRIVAGGHVAGQTTVSPAAHGLYIVAVRCADGSSAVTKLEL